MKEYVDNTYVNRPIRIVVLAGGMDFGRCPMASHLAPVLWPVLGRSPLERILKRLADDGIHEVSVCIDSELADAAKFQVQGSGLSIEWILHELPVGTAGCVREAARGFESGTIVVMPACILQPPSVKELLSLHYSNDAVLTMFCNPVDEVDPERELIAMYAFEADALEHIPEIGYWDIKERIIPEMAVLGKPVCRSLMSHRVYSFRDKTGYLQALSASLEELAASDGALHLYPDGKAGHVWTADDVRIDASAKIVGPVVVKEGVSIAKDTIILGPTVLERNVRIEEGVLVRNSVLWEGTHVGPDCELTCCVAGYNAVIPPQTVAADASIISANSGDSSHVCMEAGQASLMPGAFPESLLTKVVFSLHLWSIGLLGLVGVVLLWTYWAGLEDLWDVWQSSDEYSSGLLVPFLVGYILWTRRADLKEIHISPCLWGLLALLMAQGFRLFGLGYMFGSAERLSLVLTIMALVLYLGGRQLFSKVFTVLLFLFLMLPWPGRVQGAVTLPLQGWATSSAVFCLEILGYEVLQEGNVIHIGPTSVAVAEACNGLRMITAFFVISALVVLLVRRPFWQKAVVFMSSLPIAVVCNTIRLSVTALLFTIINGEAWEKVFHDLGGYAMMPLAIGAVVFELWLFNRLTTPPVKEEPIVIHRGGSLE